MNYQRLRPDGRLHPRRGHLCTDPHRGRRDERATSTDPLGTTTREVTLTRTVPTVTARVSANPTATDAYEPAPSGELMTWRTGAAKRALPDRPPGPRHEKFHRPEPRNQRPRGTR